MSEYHKCTCPHCGQSIEYPAEGTGQTVPCPTCEKPSVLLPDVVIPSAPPKVAQAQTRKPEEADRAAYVERVRSEPATEKQKGKLRYFGYTVSPGMTKGEASDAIDECIRLHPEKDREYYNRPATEEQMAQLRESARADKDLAEMLKALDEVVSSLTYGEAKDLIRDSESDAQRREIDRFSNPPDESQLEEFGHKVDTQLKDIITGADLEGILSLKGAPPRQVDVNLFEQHGMTDFQGDGIAAYALGDLIRAFGGSAQDHNRKRLNYFVACQAAGSDPAYHTPVLTRDWEGFVAFSWPKGKIREWLRAARRHSQR